MEDPPVAAAAGVVLASSPDVAVDESVALDVDVDVGGIYEPVVVGDDEGTKDPFPYTLSLEMLKRMLETRGVVAPGTMRLKKNTFDLVKSHLG